MIDMVLSIIFSDQIAQTENSLRKFLDTLSCFCFPVCYVMYSNRIYPHNVVIDLIKDSIRNSTEIIVF